MFVFYFVFSMNERLCVFINNSCTTYVFIRKEFQMENLFFLLLYFNYQYSCLFVHTVIKTGFEIKINIQEHI